MPDEVGGHEVGRELDAREGAAEHLRERLDGQRLGEAGHALEQHVAAGEQRDEQALEHRVLPDDHALDLVQRLLEHVARVLAARARGRRMSWSGVTVRVSFRGVAQIEAAEPAQRQAGAGQQQHEAAGRERRRHLALLVAAAELRAEPLVDGVEAVGRRRR